MGRSQLTFVAAAAAAILLGVALPAAPAAHGASFVPARFIAKTYTEALGRLPDEDGWNRALHALHRSGCSADTLATWALGVYTSAEFRRLGYGPEALVLVAYRGVLDREPDARGYEVWRDRLADGAPFTTLVQELFQGREFRRLAGRICGSPAYRGAHLPPLAIGPELPDYALQAMLWAAWPTGTVALPPRTLVRLHRELVVPEGVTLTTQGVTSRNRYADMVRLVRAGDLRGWTRPVVTVMPGGSVRYLWIDGQRHRPANKRDNAVTLYAEMGDRRTVIAHNRVGNSPGDQTIKGGDDRIRSAPCAGLSVVNNLVTAYSSSASPAGSASSPWTDGIFVMCNRATVARNEVVDASDVGIVAFRNSLGTVAVDIRDNRVLQAGNDAFGGIVADAWHDGTPTSPMSFEGTRFRRNVLWTGPHVQFQIAIGAGTRPWGLRGLGRAAVFADNTTGAMSARAAQFLSVNGMLDATTRGNGGNVVLVRPSGRNVCHPALSVANPAAASGSLQPHEPHDNSGCIRA